MIMSNEVGVALCRALEIDISRIRAITIKLEANEPAIIEIERSMTGVEGDQLATIMEAFVLTEKAEMKEPVDGLHSV